jgi:hypothetical protein
MTKIVQQQATPDRLRYELIQEHHAAELQRALCDPRVYEFISGPCPTPSELKLSFARKATGAPTHRPDECWLDYAVRLRDTGKAIGRLEATLIGRRAEVAYLFGTDFWGCGYATDGLAWLHELLAGSFGVVEFWATVAPGNLRSRRLLERAGYEPAAPETWPDLRSYDPGDCVFHRLANFPETPQT